VKRWVDRYRAGEPLTDRSSRPRMSPGKLAVRTERRIIALRFGRRWGPHRIGFYLGLPRSTVGRVLVRYRMPRLADLDRVTGLPVRTTRPARYEVAVPGQLVHVDVKKQGRIPDGGGWRAHGRGSAADRQAGAARDRAARAGAVSSRGYRYLHHAVDDHSRLVYSEILDNERKETAAAFWRRANAFFAAAGITVTAVMTDNGPCYRSRDFAVALGAITHKRTRPYRPQTNGKVERFNRTLQAEWAYAATYDSDQARAAAYPAWLHHYNHHRPHTGIGGAVPSDRVHNLTGNYT
jgi:transposase InsO family protein